MFLRNAWYLAAPTAALDEKDLIALTMLGEPIVLFRGANKQVSALEDRCVHRMAPLSLGRIEGDSLRCMYHGLLINQAGKVTEIPGQDMIPERACVRRYAVENRSGWLWVWMGNANDADYDMLPAVPGIENPDWLLPGDVLDYECNYELLNNNLTDLGHLAWVHKDSFGADQTWTNTIPDVTPIKYGVRINRWLRSIPPIPPLGKAAGVERVDHWAQLDYLVPGVFSFYNSMWPVGTADSYESKEPSKDDPAMLFEHYTQQAVTPMTERSTRYHFTWGPSARHGDDEIAAIMRQVLAVAFQEDKIVIEAQQRNIDLDPSRMPMPTVHDKGVTIFQRLMHKLIREQDQVLEQAA
jgi:phenylpropionate dioxygenase-like ring-hydroxylating dioxygenase large terminal subunit